MCKEQNIYCRICGASATTIELCPVGKEMIYVDKNGMGEWEDFRACGGYEKEVDEIVDLGEIEHICDEVFEKRRNLRDSLVKEVLSRNDGSYRKISGDEKGRKRVRVDDLLG